MKSISCLKHLALAIAILLGGSKAFAALACEDLFRVETVKAQKPAVDPAVQAQADVLIARMFDGIAERRWLTSKPAITPQLKALVAKKGLMWWNIRIYIAESIEAAKHHSATEPDGDPLMQGVYLISPKGVDLTKQEGPEVFNRLYAQSGLYYVRKGVVQKIDDGFVKREFAPGEIYWITSDAERGPFLAQSGWAFPEQRGVVLYSKTVGSSTYASIRKLTRKLIAQGWRVTYNRDFKAALDMVANQKRLVAGEWVQNSRYLLDKELYDATLESFKQGHGFSVEVWNEKGQLVGGIIGEKEGSIYSPDSTFYNQEMYPKYSIDLAKIGAVALLDRLNQAGIPFVDAGMVSNFTKGLKGEYIPDRDFLRLMDDLASKPTPVVDFDSDYVP